MKKATVICFFDNDGSSTIQNSIIKEIEKDFKNVEFRKIIGKDNGENERYGIREFPSIVIEVNGEVKEKFSGLTQQLFLRRALDKLIK